jgi:hypothetical protein
MTAWKILSGLHSRRWIVAIGGLIALIPLSVYSRGFHGTIHRTLRIGFQNSPPYHFPDAQNQPSGIGVDIVKAAARDRGIHLEWVFSPKGPEQALSSGSVDLWPIIADLQERRKLLYVSPPWARVTYAIVFPQSLPVAGPEDIGERTMAVASKISSDARIAQQYFPNATIVPRSTGEIVAAVCTGAAEAGLLSLNAFSDARTPDCRIGPLSIRPMEGATFWFGVGANKGRRDAMWAADEIRDEIGLMATDGRLASIDFRWNTKVSV